MKQYILAISLFLLGCQSPVNINGFIYCYDPQTGENVYSGPFVGALAIDTKGKGSVIFRSEEDELSQIIVGANCIIKYY